MYNLVQSLIQHVNSLNRGSAGKERLKTDELTGINFTGNFVCFPLLINVALRQSHFQTPQSIPFKTLFKLG